METCRRGEGRSEGVLPAQPLGPCGAVLAPTSLCPCLAPQGAQPSHAAGLTTPPRGLHICRFRRKPHEMTKTTKRRRTACVVSVKKD